MGCTSSTFSSSNEEEFGIPPPPPLPFSSSSSPLNVKNKTPSPSQVAPKSCCRPPNDEKNCEGDRTHERASKEQNVSEELPKAASSSSSSCFAAAASSSKPLLSSSASSKIFDTAPSSSSLSSKKTLQAIEDSTPSSPPKRKSFPSSASSKKNLLTIDTSSPPVSSSSPFSSTNQAKKVSLLQTMKLRRGSGSSTTLSAKSSPTRTSSSPLMLSELMEVEVPDDFKKKYKIVSKMAEKPMRSFSFRSMSSSHSAVFEKDTKEEGKDADEERSLTEGEEEDDGDGVILYKAIDRQRKYVTVEKTFLNAFHRSNLQVDYFERIDAIRMIDHISVCKILGVFDSWRDYSIVFEYAVGKSLQQLMTERGALQDLAVIQKLVLALIDTLKHLHKLGIAHRNVSPSHLIMSRYQHFRKKKELKLTGLSRVVRIPSEEQSSFHLSAVPEEFLDVYSAPELSTPQHGLEVDLYSLGVIIYTLISGGIPSNSLDIQVDSLSCRSKLKRVIKSLMHVDPKERPSLRKVEKYFQKSFLVSEAREDESERCMKSNSADMSNEDALPEIRRAFGKSSSLSSFGSEGNEPSSAGRRLSKKMSFEAKKMIERSDSSEDV